MKSDLCKFNINNYATVTLTEFGAKIYNERYDDIKHIMPTKYVFQNTDVKAGYVLKEQLWTLFKYFGQHLGLGMSSPFEQCIIEFDMKDFENV